MERYIIIYHRHFLGSSLFELWQNTEDKQNLLRRRSVTAAVASSIDRCDWSLIYL